MHAIQIECGDSHLIPIKASVELSSVYRFGNTYLAER